MAVRCAVAALAAALVAGCGSSAETTTGPLSDEEIDFVHSAGRWQRQFISQVGNAHRVRNALLAGQSDQAAYGRAYEPVLNCAERLGDRLGEPPTRRLQAFTDAVRAVCREGARAADLELRGARGATHALAEADLAWTEANEDLLRARDLLRPLLAKDRKRPHARATGERTVVEPRLSNAASRIAHKEVEIVCPTWDDWEQLVRERNAVWGDPLTFDIAGFADADARRAFLLPDHCMELAGALYGGRREPTEDLAWTLGTLAHETEHLVGPAPESTIECHGLQRVDDLALALGFTASNARALARRYWRDVHPDLTAEYRSRECRDGGELDQNPSSAVWP